MKFLYLRTQSAFNLKAGGSVGHTSGVINALAKKYPIEIITNDFLPGVEAETTLIPPKYIKWIPTNLNELRFNWKITKRDIQIDEDSVIYQRHAANSFAGAYLSKKNNIPFILEFNSSEAWTLKNWKKQYSFSTISGLLMNAFKYFIELPIVQLVEKFNLKNADTIIVVSEELKRILMEMQVPASKIVVYPNGINPKKFNPAIDGSSIREKYKLANRKILGFIGSFGPWHGVVELAEAIVTFFKTYPEQQQEVSFLLIGDGLLMPKVKEIIQNSPYGENVILTGTVPQDQAPTYLAACDILLSPHVPNKDGTKFFGSPTKLFEYMAMGKAIIASDLEQIGEILEHKNTAILVKPRDISALSEAMKLLITSENLATEMGHNARRDVISKFTWDIHVENIIQNLLRIHPYLKS